jgi:hypothetical protein
MPNVATLKNAYRDRPSKQRRGRDDAEADDDHGGSGDEPEERKKVPQSFTFLRREG